MDKRIVATLILSSTAGIASATEAPLSPVINTARDAFIQLVTTNGNFIVGLIALLLLWKFLVWWVNRITTGVKKERKARARITTWAKSVNADYILNDKDYFKTADGRNRIRATHSGDFAPKRYRSRSYSRRKR